MLSEVHRQLGYLESLNDPKRNCLRGHARIQIDKDKTVTAESCGLVESNVCTMYASSGTVICFHVLTCLG